jgi:uroporphyrin-III C-methyltransferase/precorrin-2 dehydrogenase/sirohydrochlorin ferrochelatase
MHSLPLFHRIAGEPVILVGEGEAAEAKRRLIERAGGLVVGFDNVDARLAFVALPSPLGVVADLRVRGILVNVVDRPDLCDFTVPSLLERGPVVVAVGTGGVSAGLAKALRLRLEALLPASLGALADGLGKARAVMRTRWPEAGERRRALDAALVDGGALDPMRTESAEALDDWLDGAEDGAAAVYEFTVSTDDPDDLTLRQARWLGTADLVAHEPGVSAAILHRARADAVRLALSRGQLAPAAAGVVVTIRRG